MADTEKAQRRTESDRLTAIQDIGRVLNSEWQTAFPRRSRGWVDVHRWTVDGKDLFLVPRFTPRPPATALSKLQREDAFGAC